MGPLVLEKRMERSVTQWRVVRGSEELEEVVRECMERHAVSEKVGGADEEVELPYVGCGRVRAGGSGGCDGCGGCGQGGGGEDECGEAGGGECARAVEVAVDEGVLGARLYKECGLCVEEGVI